MAPITTPTRGRRRRVTIILAAVAIAALTLPTVALAASPIRTTEVVHGTAGEITTADATVKFNITYGTLYGASGNIRYEGPHGTLFGPEGFAEMSDNRLTGEFFLIDGETGESPGWALYDIAFTPGGPESATHEVIRTGNRRTVVDLVQQPMLASGTITMPDGTIFRFEDLPGDRFVADLWSNNPAATVLDGAQTFIEANWVLDDLPLIFRVHVTDLSSGGAVFLQTDGGEIIGEAQPTFVDDRMRADFTLAEFGETVGSASVDVQVTELGNSFAFEQTETSRLRTVTTQIAVAGELTVTLHDSTRTFEFADADLVAVRESWHGIQYPHADDGGDGGDGGDGEG